MFANYLLYYISILFYLLFNLQEKKITNRGSILQNTLQYFVRIQLETFRTGIHLGYYILVYCLLFLTPIYLTHLFIANHNETKLILNKVLIQMVIIQGLIECIFRRIMLCVHQFVTFHNLPVFLL